MRECKLLLHDLYLVCDTGVIFFVLIMRRLPRSTRSDTHLPYSTLVRAFAEAARDEHRPFERIGTLAAKLEQHGAEQAVLRARSEEHTAELQSLMRSTYAVLSSNKKKIHT